MMSKKIDNVYQDYLRFRKDNDDLRIQEQGKMDKIIFSCSIGLIGIAFGFVGIIFQEQSICWSLFILSILCTCLSVASNYYSSWYSVKDILLANDILDERYKNGENIYQEITSKYTGLTSLLNNVAMLFLVLGILLFFIFVYVNISLKPYNIKENTMTNINFSCEGCGKNKPTVAPNSQKTFKPNKKINNGAERSKPTVAPKENTSKSTGKK